MLSRCLLVLQRFREGNSSRTSSLRSQLPGVWGGGGGTLGREGTLAPLGEGTLAIQRCYLKDAGWSLQPEDGMQEKNSLSKFSPFSHIGQKRSGVVETGLFGKRVETKSLRSTGLGIFVTSPRPPHRTGTLVLKRLVWRRVVKAAGPTPESGVPGREKLGTRAEATLEPRWGGQVGLCWAFVCPERARATQPRR